jgi:hypothetical protein
MVVRILLRVGTIDWSSLVDWSVKSASIGKFGLPATDQYG